MKIFDKHLLVSDFDGTLIDSSQRISKANLDAIKYFTENGGLFCGATGRTPYNIGPYMEGLPLNCPWILFNGASLHDFRDNTVKKLVPVKRHPLKEIVEKLIAVFPSICVQLYTKDKFYLVNPNGREDKEIKIEKQVFYYGDMNNIDEPWIKIILHEENYVLKKAFELINNEDKNKNYRTFFSVDTYLEITHLNVSKGSMLDTLRKVLGERISKVIAIGDYLNDIEMIKNADIKAAPRNAHPEIKSIADFITVDNDHNAIADLINILHTI